MTALDHFPMLRQGLQAPGGLSQLVSSSDKVFSVVYSAVPGDPEASETVTPEATPDTSPIGDIVEAPRIGAPLMDYAKPQMSAEIRSGRLDFAAERPAALGRDSGQPADVARLPSVGPVPPPGPDEARALPAHSGVDSTIPVLSDDMAGPFPVEKQPNTSQGQVAPREPAAYPPPVRDTPIPDTAGPGHAARNIRLTSEPGTDPSQGQSRERSLQPNDPQQSPKERPVNPALVMGSTTADSGIHSPSAERHSLPSQQMPNEHRAQSGERTIQPADPQRTTNHRIAVPPSIHGSSTRAASDQGLIAGDHRLPAQQTPNPHQGPMPDRLDQVPGTRHTPPQHATRFAEVSIETYRPETPRTKAPGTNTVAPDTPDDVSGKTRFAAGTGADTSGLPVEIVKARILPASPTTGESATPWAATTTIGRETARSDSPGVQPISPPSVAGHSNATPRLLTVPNTSGPALEDAPATHNPGSEKGIAVDQHDSATARTWADQNVRRVTNSEFVVPGAQPRLQSPAHPLPLGNQGEVGTRVAIARPVEADLPAKPADIQLPKTSAGTNQPRTHSPATPVQDAADPPGAAKADPNHGPSAPAAKAQQTPVTTTASPQTSPATPADRVNLETPHQGLPGTGIASEASGAPGMEPALGLSAGDAPLKDAAAPATFRALQDARVPPQIAAQLIDVARSLPDGPVELSLNPEELGRVRMTLTPGDGTIMVSLAAERGETADLLRRHAEMLAQEFRELGYREVTFDFSGNRDWSHAKDHSPDTPHELASDPVAPTPQQPDVEARPGPGTTSGMDLRL